MLPPIKVPNVLTFEVPNELAKNKFLLEHPTALVQPSEQKSRSQQYSMAQMKELNAFPKTERVTGINAITNNK